jgi:hypothetical protein
MHIRPESPVFVDRTGRRRRLFVVIGMGSSVLLILAAGALLAGFIGIGPGHQPGWPGSGQDRAAATPGMVGQGGVSPSPTKHDSSASPGTPVPGTSATPGSASPSPTGRRNEPTHTPTAHPSKKK